MRTQITLSTERMKRDEIPKYLKEHNAQLANWDECVNDKVFLKDNEKELLDRWVWVDSKNLKKIDTKELYVTDLAFEQSKKAKPLTLGVGYDGRYWLYLLGDYYFGGVARVAMKLLEKVSTKRLGKKEDLERLFESRMDNMLFRLESLELWRKRVSK